MQKLTCKKRDAWWTVLLVDPVATRVLIRIARFGFITPNGVTWAALFVGLGSAGFFLRGDTQSLIIGAALYHVSFILDCIDGKLARLKGNGTVFGGWLDYVFDRIRVLFCALALMGGQYLRSESAWYLIAALVVVFLDMLRYVDALQIYKMRMSMRTKIEKLKEARREAEAPEGPGVVFMEDLLRENPGVEADLLKQQAENVVDLHAQFRDRFPWYTRLRQALLRTRMRPHLISGIEFQMFIFIIGPLIGQILWTTAVSAVLLGLFELVIMYKFWLSTRDFTRVVEELAPEPLVAVGSVASHLHAGRHRRGGDEPVYDPVTVAGVPVEQRFPAPEPYEDPGFQPYPEPRHDVGFRYDEQDGHAAPGVGYAADPVFHPPGPHADVRWVEAEGRRR
ncbi:CDP-alcohol phosphatidyltransferase family protein [Streptomyces sp. CA-278952]|uniref:CDP-alcohol phosphatidyltransferase family protein n=1 Tax=unclassified Streptomyces TaxID=2593676 RepID=UPI0022428121|nr:MULTISPECIES: CDP-alcohol phosphatidyltransferase family protein [unclassified Streptomyces]UZI27824.1 CDP-alcohol phosphatidyltransferase family protein [Streptomyces sp. VB1]WDG28015.1 CDP-alcohol phosphatidyltransferase family protein [Streptomyces sp. CA-278952]